MTRMSPSELRTMIAREQEYLAARRERRNLAADLVPPALGAPLPLLPPPTPPPPPLDADPEFAVFASDRFRVLDEREHRVEAQEAQLRDVITKVREDIVQVTRVAWFSILLFVSAIILALVGWTHV